MASTTPSSATDPFITLNLSATDTLSGIGAFHISIDGGVETVLVPTEKTDAVYRAQFRSGVLSSGKHTVVVVAKDLAGNSVTESTDVTISPLVPPKIIEYTANVVSQKPFTARGETYPLGKIDILFKKEGGDDIQKKIITDAGFFWHQHNIACRYLYCFF
jgi:hypothetical protein